MNESIDELIKRFNNVVSGLDVSQQDKLTLLVLLTEIGYKCKKTADAIEELQKRKHVKWIPSKEPPWLDCSECGQGSVEYTNFCSNCGAQMESDGE